jgi:DNA ligase D-like protein (predicted ligase)
MPDWLEKLKPSLRERVHRQSMPDPSTPMLATLTDERFSSPDWIFERKIDGERCLASSKPQRTRLTSRNDKTLNESYPELVEAIAGQRARSFIVDGEIVAFDGKLTSFARLQGRMNLADARAIRDCNIAVYLYLFDLLYLDGYSIECLPLRARKSLLKSQFDFADPVRFTVHHNTRGKACFSDACRRGWEGLIAKRADARYTHGRSTNWLKFKCVNSQEFVICGYTEPRGSRQGFGALLLGYYENDELRYAGKVGTGFNEPLLLSLEHTLESRERESNPFDRFPNDNSPRTHWVRPALVAEIGFTEWTRAGRLRHPRFLGLRRDKEAREVRRERA